MVPRPAAAGTAADPPGVGLVFLAFDVLASAVRVRVTADVLDR